MPVSLIKSVFADAEFSPTTFVPGYVSNTGDRIKAIYTVKSSIRVSSLSNLLQFDPIVDEITWASGNWLAEGFRIGDTINITIYTSGGGVINSFNTTIESVTETVLNVAAVPTWYDITTGQFAVISIPSKAGRGDLQFMFNHVSNINGGTEFSLIDGEVTRGVFLNINSLAIGSTLTANLTGNQSGGYVTGMELERIANIDDARVYEITVEFLNPGIYDSSWFDTSDCLKTLIKLEWGRDPGDLNYLIKITDSPSANTGWFGEGHNIDTINSTLIQGIDSVDYGSPSTHTIIVDGPLTDIGIGASYIPTNSAYYKNKLLSQLNLGMVCSTQDILTVANTSATNGNGAGYEILIDSISVSGSQTTIEITITPNAFFFDFVDALDEGDRLFYVWIKCGNVNHLAFADQLTYTAPPGDPLVMTEEVAYYSHGQNINDGSGSDFTTTFNTEDDIGYFGSFLLEKESTYSSFIARIQAYNPTTGADFTLLQAVFDFAGVPYSSDGRYLLNEVIAINSILPLTSLKRESKLYLESSLDTSTEYGVSIYFPFILRWEYWLQQLNASVDFWPNQNKNWLQYDNTDDWEVRLQLELNDDLSHTHEKEITILDYDSEPQLQNEIELKIESTGQIVGVVVEGELMRITATHELLNNYVWDQTKTWGHITVEPYEGAPRWMVSSVVPTDGNVLNPLSPISGTLVNIIYVSPKIAKMECFFDPSKLDLSKGCKFTSKIKGCQAEPVKTMTDGTVKTMTDGTSKTIAI